MYEWLQSAQCRCRVLMNNSILLYDVRYSDDGIIFFLPQNGLAFFLHSVPVFRRQRCNKHSKCRQATRSPIIYIPIMFVFTTHVNFKFKIWFEKIGNFLWCNTCCVMLRKTNISYLRSLEYDYVALRQRELPYVFSPGNVKIFHRLRNLVYRTFISSECLVFGDCYEF